MRHALVVTLLIVAAVFLMIVEWLLHLTKREALRLDLIAWACVFAAVAFATA